MRFDGGVNGHGVERVILKSDGLVGFGGSEIASHHWSAQGRPATSCGSASLGSSSMAFDSIFRRVAVESLG